MRPCCNNARQRCRGGWIEIELCCCPTGPFAQAHNLAPEDFLIFYFDEVNALRVAIKKALPATLANGLVVDAPARLCVGAPPQRLQAQTNDSATPLASTSQRSAAPSAAEQAAAAPKAVVADGSRGPLQPVAIPGNQQTKEPRLPLEPPAFKQASGAPQTSENVAPRGGASCGSLQVDCASLDPWQQSSEARLFAWAGNPSDDSRRAAPSANTPAGSLATLMRHGYHHHGIGGTSPMVEAALLAARRAAPFSTLTPMSQIPAAAASPAPPLFAAGCLSEPRLPWTRHNSQEPLRAAAAQQRGPQQPSARAATDGAAAAGRDADEESDGVEAAEALTMLATGVTPRRLPAAREAAPAENGGKRRAEAQRGADEGPRRVAARRADDVGPRAHAENPAAIPSEFARPPLGPASAAQEQPSFPLMPTGAPINNPALLFHLLQQQQLQTLAFGQLIQQQLLIQQQNAFDNLFPGWAAAGGTGGGSSSAAAAAAAAGVGRSAQEVLQQIGRDLNDGIVLCKILSAEELHHGVIVVSRQLLVDKGVPVGTGEDGGTQVQMLDRNGLRYNCVLLPARAPGSCRLFGLSEFLQGATVGDMLRIGNGISPQQQQQAGPGSRGPPTYTVRLLKASDVSHVAASFVQPTGPSR